MFMRRLRLKEWVGFALRRQLGVAAIDYFQLLGHYHGAFRGEGRTYDVDGVHGVCEKMRARM